MTARADLIRQHIPSITELVELMAAGGRDPEAFDEDGDYIGMIRECRCGLVIEGYYEYTDHLIALFDEAGL